jgi:hypothetical protein
LRPVTKTSIAFLVGLAGIVFSLMIGEAAPSLTNAGAVTYWLALAFGIPAFLAGLIWVLRWKHPTRSRAAASAFLLFTVLESVAMVIGPLAQRVGQ